MESNINDKNYLTDLTKIKETIRLNQNKAMVVVNSMMILTYYEIGTIINERKSWGNKYIQRLSEDLKDYGKGYSFPNLKRMSQLANTFTREEISSQAGSRIPGRTLIEIISHSKSKEEMLWYINETYNNSWSRSMLINQFELKAYERNLIKPIVSPRIKESDNELVNNLFKESYVFDFIDRNNILSEKRND